MHKYEALAGSMNQCYEGRKAFLTEFAYHYGHTGRETIFHDGNRYWAISKTKPKYDVGREWAAHSDQFWPEKIGLTVWVA